MSMSDPKKWTGLLSLLTLLVVIALVTIRSGVISSNSSPDDEQTSVDLRDLAALPYTQFVVEPEERKQFVGVTICDESLVYPGVNLYCNQFQDTTGAYLVDMKGEVVHQWQAPDNGTLSMATVDGDGNIYCITPKGLLKLDWSSNVLFNLPEVYHHDIQFRDDGIVVTLRQEKQLVRHEGKAFYILDDYLTFISPDGQVVEDFSLWRVVRDLWVVRRVLNEVKKDPRDHRESPLDLLHANTADVLEQDIPGFCKRGNILICMRNLDLICVYDHEADELVWQYRANDVWQHPHEPRLLRNGRVMIFDNGRRRGWSRILELDPLTKKVLWEYRGDPRESFHTAVRGSIQRFPNGNTLITESDKGRVFEITRKGEIVWEWYNPLFSDGKRAVVYRMNRLEEGAVDEWMANDGRPRRREHEPR